MNDSRTIKNDGVVLLQVQGDMLVFIPPAGSNPPQGTLVGSLSGIRSLLAQEPLTEAKLEAAITLTEELVMPIIRSLPAGAALKVSGPVLAEVVDLLPTSNPASNGATFAIESVELLFNQLADYAAGSPAAWRHPTSPADLALGLVVLREVMHHGGYLSVSLQTRTG